LEKTFSLRRKYISGILICSQDWVYLKLSLPGAALFHLAYEVANKGNGAGTQEQPYKMDEER
jgi:hypothetical protein